MLQSTDPMKLSNSEGSREEAWISLRRENNSHQRWMEGGSCVEEGMRRGTGIRGRRGLGVRIAIDGDISGRSWSPRMGKVPGSLWGWPSWDSYQGRYGDYREMWPPPPCSQAELPVGWKYKILSMKFCSLVRTEKNECARCVYILAYNSNFKEQKERDKQTTKYWDTSEIKPLIFF